MAGAVGFEPTNVGSKVPCLTAWLRPNLFKYYTPLCLNDKISHLGMTTKDMDSTGT